MYHDHYPQVIYEKEFRETIFRNKESGERDKKLWIGRLLWKYLAIMLDPHSASLSVA